MVIGRKSNVLNYAPSIICIKFIHGEHNPARVQVLLIQTNFYGELYCHIYCTKIILIRLISYLLFVFSCSHFLPTLLKQSMSLQIHVEYQHCPFWRRGTAYSIGSQSNQECYFHKIDQSKWTSCQIFLNNRRCMNCFVLDRNQWSVTVFAWLMAK